MRPLSLILFLLLFTVGASFSQGTAQPESADLGKSISLYPNPVTEYLNIKLPLFNAQEIKLSLYNILGNEVQAETEIVDDHHIRIRVKEFTEGYYLVAVRDEKSKFLGTYKFLKR